MRLMMDISVLSQESNSIKTEGVMANDETGFCDAYIWYLMQGQPYQMMDHATARV